MNLFVYENYFICHFNWESCSSSVEIVMNDKLIVFHIFEDDLKVDVQSKNSC